jgi:putative FmdB family regulatory protein
MKFLYDFKCSSCGNQFETLVTPTEKETECMVCGSLASRKLSAPRSKLEGITGSFPTASDAWARKHEEAAKIAYKREQS